MRRKAKKLAMWKNTSHVSGSGSVKRYRDGSEVGLMAMLMAMLAKNKVFHRPAAIRMTQNKGG